MSDKKREFEELGRDALGDFEREVADAVDQEFDEEIEKIKKEVGVQEDGIVVDDVPLSLRDDLTPEEADELLEQKVAKVMQILNRGQINDSLENLKREHVPPGYRSKFVRESEEAIVRYQNLGFGFTYREGAKSRGHATGDGRIRYGDTVLMTISEEDWNILQIVRKRQIRRKLGDARREYMRRVEERNAAPSFDESVTTIG